MDWTGAIKVGASVLLSLGGGGALVAAFSSWLGKVWANRILEQDRARYQREIEALRSQFEANLARLNSELDAANRRIQAELDKRLFVNRVQFEKEFECLARVWRAVAEVRASFNGLRPELSIVSATENPQEALRKRFAEYQRRVSDLREAVHYFSPFYPQDVYAQLSKLIDTCHLEQMQVATHDPNRDPRWFEQGKENCGAFNQGAARVSDLIRTRLASISIIEP